MLIETLELKLTVDTSTLDFAQVKANLLLSTLRQIKELQSLVSHDDVPTLENMLKEQKRANELLESLLRSNQAHCSLAAQVLSQ